MLCATMQACRGLLEPRLHVVRCVPVQQGVGARSKRSVSFLCMLCVRHSFIVVYADDPSGGGSYSGRPTSVI
jgi:hypothetical protein